MTLSEKKKKKKKCQFWDSHSTSTGRNLSATTFIGIRRGRKNLNDNPKEHDALL